MKKLSGHPLYLFLILLFSLWGMKALFHPGLFTAHDIWHQVVRLYYYYSAINDGQFLPNWIGQLANGFGYPLFFFSYHLPWILGVLLLKIGLDIPTAIKSLFYISFLGSGISMYFFANSLLKNKFSALLSAVLYLWLPYHFLTIFVSASMGIAFVFTFFPLILWGIHLLKEKNKAGLPTLALGLSGVILSHIMHLIFLSPLIVSFLIWGLSTSDKRDFLTKVAFGTILGILISSFYILPALYYSPSTRIRQETGFSTLYQRNFISLKQLIYSKWGFSPIVNNAKNGEISFQLGIAQWISILALAALIILKKLKKTYLILSIYLIIAFAISIFLMLDFSKPVWAYLVKFTMVDFPFRLLLPATFIASLIAGIVYINLNKRIKVLFLIFIIGTAIYTNRNHINVNQYTDFPISTYLNIETEITTNTFNEYLPLKASGKLLNTPWNEITGENASTSNTRHTTNQLSFNLNVVKESSVSAGQFFFPGQALYIDNNPTRFTIDREGRISFLAPAGRHSIEVKYEGTPLITVSKFLSLAGLLLLSFLFLKNSRSFKKK